MSPTTKLVFFVVGSVTLMAAFLWWILLMRVKEAKERARARKRKLDPMPDNMGPASREEIEAYAAYVFEVLGFEGFEMRWTTAGSICMKRSILIDESFISKYRWQAKEIVLHEIAHFATRPTDDVHGRVFYNRYVALLTRFMCQERARPVPNQPVPDLRELGGRSIPERPTPTPSTTITSSWGRKRKHGD